MMTPEEIIQGRELIALAKRNCQYYRRVYFDAAANEWLLDYVVTLPLCPSIWRLGDYRQARKKLRIFADEN